MSSEGFFVHGKKHAASDPRLPYCVGREDLTVTPPTYFNAGYGRCNTYDRRKPVWNNFRWCAADGALEECSECEQCVDKIVHPPSPPPSSPPPAPPAAPPPGLPHHNGMDDTLVLCVERSTFNAGYGPCMTYAKRGGVNFHWCALDGALEECSECLSCVDGPSPFATPSPEPDGAVSPAPEPEAKTSPEPEAKTDSLTQSVATNPAATQFSETEQSGIHRFRKSQMKA